MSSRFCNINQISNSQYIDSWENKNTKEKTIRDIKLLEEFLHLKKESRKICEIPPEDLNSYLAEFIRSVKRKDGKDFEPSSLRSFISSFERHLKRENYPSSIITDRCFETTRKCLLSKQKELKSEGRGNKDHAAATLTDKDIDILYENQLLGLHSPESIVNTLWLNNSIHFGLRGCQEHRKMFWEDVKLVKDSEGVDYLEYTERQTKTRTGTDTENTRKVKPKMFATSTERNPVAVYKAYSEMRPANMNTPEAPFYLGINHTKIKNTNKNWFKSAPMGVNKLFSLMKTMCKKANLENERLTNHSARKYMIQTLNDNEIPPSHIMQISGHKNVQSITNYSHVNINQQKRISNILSSGGEESCIVPAEKKAKKSLEVQSATASTTTTTEGQIPLKLFEGAVIHGGDFHITINTLNESPTLPTVTKKKERRWKRLVIDSDSD